MNPKIMLPGQLTYLMCKWREIPMCTDPAKSFFARDLRVVNVSLYRSWFGFGPLRAIIWFRKEDVKEDSS